MSHKTPEKSPWANPKLENVIDSEEKILKEVAECIMENNLSLIDIELAMNIFLEPNNKQLKKEISQKNNAEFVYKLVEKITKTSKESKTFIPIPKLKKYMLDRVIETDLGFKDFLRTLPLGKTDRDLFCSICESQEEGVLQLLGKNTEKDLDKKISTQAPDLEELLVKMGKIIGGEMGFFEMLNLSKEGMGDTKEAYRLSFMEILKNINFPERKNFSIIFIPKELVHDIQGRVLGTLIGKDK